jgi:hypothetical protein
MPSSQTGGCLSGRRPARLRNPNPGFVVVRAGTLDDKSGLKITGNIWTSTAAAWSHIDPSTECHPENLPPPPPKA